MHPRLPSDAVFKASCVVPAGLPPATALQPVFLIAPLDLNRLMRTHRAEKIARWKSTTWIGLLMFAGVCAGAGFVFEAPYLFFVFALAFFVVMIVPHWWMGGACCFGYGVPKSPDVSAGAGAPGGGGGCGSACGSAAGCGSAGGCGGGGCGGGGLCTLNAADHTA